ncbi:helicase-associated domain-containing protein [Paenibacillus agri]|uniref:Helicase-associated domain-containing protein n=1 Tax=Paenibacillus agri TaxID=2744309 RepID=A0A850ESN7_9BACL|nr:helicase-associated domain-containing protein [Paenibacillus agri]NUU64203.1 helicase-associated domain-containing protein [Paenibacillus agri]
MKDLTPDALELLGRLCAVYGGQPFEEGKEEQLRPAYLSRAEQRLALSELRRAGLLMARQKLWGEKLYHIPAEVLDAVSLHFYPYSPAPLAAGDVSLSMEAGPGLSGELFRALLFTAREGLPVTAKGSIHKKQVSRLAAQLSFGDEHLQGLTALSLDLGQGLGHGRGHEQLQRPGQRSGLAREQGRALGLGRVEEKRGGRDQGLGKDQVINQAIDQVTGQVKGQATGKAIGQGKGQTAGQTTGTYPLAVTVIVDLMLSLGLISPQETGYILEPEVLRNWLQLPEPQMVSILYETAAERYGSREPVQQHFRLLISRQDFLPGQWYALAGVLDWLAAMNPAALLERPALEAACLAWLRALAGFGWAELGSLQSGELCFRWTAAKPQLQSIRPAPMGAAEEEPPAAASIVQAPLQGARPAPSGAAEEQPLTAAFIVQPDFEVLVPPEVPYAMRWTLAACAELLQCDVLWSFRLTREMLEHAAVQGMPPGEVISWLQGHTPGGLPEQVEYSLEQWGRGIGRTVIEDVRLLSCLSEVEAEMIAAHPRLQDKLTRLGPLHFLVQREQEKDVHQELAEAGLAPQGTINGREPEQAAEMPLYHRERENTPAAYVVPPWEQGLLSAVTGNPLRHLPLADPELEASFLMDEGQVPPMWSREWRAYHVTTAEKVMEQGLRWGVKVRISLQEQECHFIPHRIQRNPWRVTGHLLRNLGREVEEMELTASAWKEIQLILPAAARNSSSAGATGYVMIEKSTADGRTLTQK